MNARPLPKESDDYFKKYIGQVAGDDFLRVLEDQQADTHALLRTLPPEKWEYAYAPAKWTLKEVMIHLIDAERIFAYRALRIARNDKTPLPGFEQNDYIPYAHAASRSPESILAEYEAVRRASIELFKSFDEDALKRMGTASEKPFSVRALGFTIAGHEHHHLQVIREKYI